MRRGTPTILCALLLAASLALSGCSTFTELSLRPQVQRADAAFDQGNYALAATLYESLGDRYPALPEREELRLRQAIALYTLGSYHEARNAFQAYLKTFPQGRYQAEVGVYLDKIAALLSPASPNLKNAIEAARKDLDKLQQLHLKNPYNTDVTCAIGNLYYEMGNYDEAVRYYYDALTLDAAYKEKELIRQRMVIDADGQPRPLTPEEIERIERDNTPLVVFDTHQYMAREEDVSLGNAQNRFFNVTGLVRNQASRFVERAVVEVRFLNAQSQILDVALVEVGPMGPGEVRPFRAQADSFDNIYNITRFECLPQAER